MGKIKDVLIDKMNEKEMETFYWFTTEPLPSTSHCMQNFFEEHWFERFGKEDELILDDGSYAEVKTKDGTVWGLNASGNGDFCNHKIEFSVVS